MKPELACPEAASSRRLATTRLSSWEFRPLTHLCFATMRLAVTHAVLALGFCLLASRTIGAPTRAANDEPLALIARSVPAPDGRDDGAHSAAMRRQFFDYVGRFASDTVKNIGGAINPGPCEKYKDQKDYTNCRLRTSKRGIIDRVVGGKVESRELSGHDRSARRRRSSHL